MHQQTGPLPTVTPVRGARVGDLPTVSVIVTSASERARLDGCLASLAPQCEGIGAELLVYCASDEGDIEVLRRSYPTAVFHEVAAGTSSIQMRAMGISDAEGDIVLLQDDHAVPNEWLVPRIMMNKSHSRDGAAAQ